MFGFGSAKKLTTSTSLSSSARTSLVWVVRVNCCSPVKSKRWNRVELTRFASTTVPMASERLTEAPIPIIPRRLASAPRTRRRSHSAAAAMKPAPTATMAQTAMPLPGRTKFNTQAANSRPTPMSARSPVRISATCRFRSSAPP